VRQLAMVRVSGPEEMSLLDSRPRWVSFTPSFDAVFEDWGCGSAHSAHRHQPLAKGPICEHLTVGLTYAVRCWTHPWS